MYAGSWIYTEQLHTLSDSAPGAAPQCVSLSIRVFAAYRIRAAPGESFHSTPIRTPMFRQTDGQTSMYIAVLQTPSEGRINNTTQQRQQKRQVY